MQEQKIQYSYFFPKVTSGHISHVSWYACNHYVICSMTMIVTFKEKEEHIFILLDLCEIKSMSNISLVSNLFNAQKPIQTEALNMVFVQIHQLMET